MYLNLRQLDVPKHREAFILTQCNVLSFTSLMEDIGAFLQRSTSIPYRSRHTIEHDPYCSFDKTSKYDSSEHLEDFWLSWAVCLFVISVSDPFYHKRRKGFEQLLVEFIWNWSPARDLTKPLFTWSHGTVSIICSTGHLIELSYCYLFIG